MELEFKTASKITEPKFRQKEPSRWVSVAIEREVRDKLKSKGYKPNEALKHFLFWEDMRPSFFRAIIAEIERLGNKIDNLENMIIGKSDQRGYM